MSLFQYLMGGASHGFVMSPDDEGGAGGGDAGASGSGDAGQGAEAAASGDAGQGVDGAGGDAGASGAGDAGQGAEASHGKDNPTQSAFPADWRERMATGADGKVDKSKMNLLSRYNTPADYANAHYELRQKLHQAELKLPLGKDATPEQVAEWRKENNIPEKPDGYLDGLPEGLVFGEDDKAVLDPFLQDMHAQNVPPAAVQRALAAYHESQAKQVEMVQARDAQIAEQTQDALREEWGTDYRANIQAINGFIESQFPQDIQKALHNARLGDDDGTPLLHHPDVLRVFASLGRVLNPQSTLTHGKGVDSLDTINDEIKGLEKRMGSKDWYRDDKAQARYQELVRIRDRMNGAG